MRGTVLLVLAIVLLVLVATAVFVVMKRGGGVQMAGGAAEGSFYDLTTRTLDGSPASLRDFRGRVALVVNVASRCGLTPQYEGLERLHEQLTPKGFTVLGFPSNDFGGQEPGTSEEIRTFCSATYGVTFPMFEKRRVKGGEKDDVYRFLTRGLEEPTWNFTKYLVGRDGRVRARFGPKVAPEDAELRAAIDQAISEA
jgi:glutathione peroxidase